MGLCLNNLYCKILYCSTDGAKNRSLWLWHHTFKVSNGILQHTSVTVPYCSYVLRNIWKLGGFVRLKYCLCRVAFRTAGHSRPMWAHPCYCTVQVYGNSPITFTDNQQKRRENVSYYIVFNIHQISILLTISNKQKGPIFSYYPW